MKRLLQEQLLNNNYTISNSFDLYVFLKNKNLIDERYKNWWPSNSDFEIFIGAILTQNTKWTNVEKSLKNLKELDVLKLEKLKDIDIELLIEKIAPSGFKNQKSLRIKKICQNIYDEFGDFENEFCKVFKNSKTCLSFLFLIKIKKASSSIILEFNINNKTCLIKFFGRILKK